MSASRMFMALMVILLTACDGMSTNDNDSNSPSSLASQTPQLLRSIPTTELDARVTLNNNTQTYLGENYPDGNWILSVTLELNQQYNIKIEWLRFGVLLMEEIGSFVTNPDVPRIQLELDFSTNGSPRFDNDCDGIPNLTEVLAGSNPEIAESTLMDACNATPATPADPNEMTSAWVAQSFPQNGPGSFSTQFTQSLQIRSHNGNLSSSYGVALYTNPAQEPRQKASIDFYYHPTIGKKIRMGFTNANRYRLPNDKNAECESIDPSVPSGVYCTIVYDWKIQNWYEFVYEKISSTEWEIWVVDKETDFRDLMGSFTLTEPDVDWYHAEVGVDYEDQLSAGDCTRGLPPTTIQFTAGASNNEFASELGKPSPKLSECVEFGGGWNGSSKTVKGESLYSLTLGLLQ